MTPVISSSLQYADCWQMTLHCPDIWDRAQLACVSVLAFIKTHTCTNTQYIDPPGWHPQTNITYTPKTWASNQHKTDAELFLDVNICLQTEVLEAEDMLSWKNVAWPWGWRAESSLVTIQQTYHHLHLSLWISSDFVSTALPSMGAMADGTNKQFVSRP